MCLCVLSCRGLCDPVPCPTVTPQPGSLALGWRGLRVSGGQGGGQVWTGPACCPQGPSEPLPF